MEFENDEGFWSLGANKLGLQGLPRPQIRIKE